MNTPNDTPFAAALHYAQNGWRVTWAPHGTKHPTQTEWQNKATTNRNTINDWFGNNQNVNICIATGQESNLWVLDVDDKPGKTGSMSLALLEQQHGTLPPTHIIATGSGGLHYYFTWQGIDYNLTNSAGRIGRDLDTRGNGGQVIAPPSRVTGGGHFQPYTTLDPRPPVAAPNWLIDLLRPTAHPSTATAPATAPPAPTGTNTPYGQAALNAAATAIARCHVGVGDHTVYHESLSMGQLIAGGQLGDPQAVIETLRWALNSWTWHRPGDETAMHAKIATCVGEGMRRQPRRAPHREQPPPPTAPAAPTQPATGPPQPPAPTPTPDGDRQIHCIPMTAYTPRRVRWLWQDRIPCGEMSLIVGRGGAGKSTLLAEFAAWITTGQMKGEYIGHPQNVLYVVNEDSMEYTVVPRLIAAGTDLTRIHSLKITSGGQWDRIMLPYDCQRIKDKIAELDAVAVFIDPLSSNLTAKKNDQDEMRPALERVRRMAEETGAAIIALAHTRKAMSTNLMDAIMGSVELANVTRSVMGVMAEPDSDDGAVVLSQEKNNLGRMNLAPYRYRIETASLPDARDPLKNVATGRVVWLGKGEESVSDMLANGAGRMDTASRSDVHEAAEWLVQYLSMNPGSPRSKVEADAVKVGIKPHTLKRSASKLHIVSQLVGFPCTAHWSLPVTSSK